jgi:hypothetical protein
VSAPGTEHANFRRREILAAFASMGIFEGAARTQPSPEERRRWLAQKLHQVGPILRDDPECLYWLRLPLRDRRRELLLAVANGCPLSYVERQLHPLTDEEFDCFLMFLAGIGQEVTQPVPIEYCDSQVETAPPQRITFDQETLSITLDRITYSSLTPPGFGILKVLYDARPAFLSSKKLQERVPGCKGGEKTLRRHINKLPKPLSVCIRARRGAGRWFQLPPNK